MNRMRCLLVLAIVAATIWSAGVAAAVDFYADGSRVNLCTIRGCVAKSSTSTDAIAMGRCLRPSYGPDVRFRANAQGKAWWQVEFPEPYMVDRFAFQYHDVNVPTQAQVQTSLDGVEWTNRTPILTSAPKVEGTFPGGAVEAKFVRLNVFSTGYSDMIIIAAKLYGPNDPEVNSAISAAQMTWNMGKASYKRNSTAAWTNLNALVDDYLNFSTILGPDIYPGGEAAPASLMVTLRKQYEVTAVGMSVINDNRRPKDVKIYVSPDETGDETWAEVASQTFSYANGNYYKEIEFAEAQTARRVRYDVLTTDGHTMCFVNKLFVYAESATTPEVVSIGDFAVADMSTGSRIFTNEAEVDVTAFTAATSVPGATIDGYNITETAVEPGGGWLAEPPTTYFLGSQGDKVLYAWAIDTEGNIGCRSFIIRYDTTAVVYSNVAVTALPDNEARVTWNTNIATEGVVKWGEVALGGLTPNSAGEGGFNTVHSVTLTGILPETNYKIAIFSNEAPYRMFGWPVDVPNVSVTEFAVADLTSGSSAFTNERTVSVTAFAAETIIPGADVAGYAIAEIDTDPTTLTYTSEPPETYTITGAEGTVTLYAYAADSAGNCSPPKTATIVLSLSLRVVMVSNAAVVDNGDGTATVTWTTDVNADSSVKYGEAALNGPTPNVVDEGGFTKTHSVVLPDIVAGTIYKIVLVNNEQCWTPPIYWPQRTLPLGYVADGSQVNLCTLRDAIASTSQNNHLAQRPRYPAYAIEIRWPNNTPSPWWQIEFPRVLKVDSYFFQYYSPGLYPAVTARLQTSLNGTDWTDQATLTDRYQPSGTLPETVDAKFVRLQVDSYLGGHPEMILQVAKLYGPNEIPVDQTVSVAQSTWNGGSVTLVDPYFGGPSNQPTLLNDFADLNWPGIAIYPNGPADPSVMTVLLRENYVVEAVGICTIQGQRAPRDMNVYLSPDETGDTFTLAATVADLPMQSAGIDVGYHEIELAVPASARRVRFDVLRSWNPPTSMCMLSELYVYGTPVPPPPSATVTDFAVADASSGSTLVTNDATVNVAAFAAETSAEGAAIDGWLITQTETPPTLESSWLAAAPATYTIAGGEGSVTLYAWAKDDAGNISPARSVSILFSTAVPAVSNVNVVDNGDNTATATWTTDLPAEGSLKYGPVVMTGATPNTVAENAVGTSHSVTFATAPGVNYKIILVNNESPYGPIYWPKPWPIDGDANGDCRVNILDLIFIRNKLNQPVGTGDNWKADVNEDTRINILDLIFVRNKLNTQCP